MINFTFINIIHFIFLTNSTNSRNTKYMAFADQTHAERPDPDNPSLAAGILLKIIMCINGGLGR